LLWDWQSTRCLGPDSTEATLSVRNSFIESLLIFGNDLSGAIPSEIGNLDLIQLQAQQNRLTGEIPSELFSNTKMVTLRLSENQLSGTISNLIGDLTDMVDLRLGNNTITGTIPFRIFGLSKLGTRHKRRFRLNSSKVEFTS
jgi:hypothetical protein